LTSPAVRRRLARHREIGAAAPRSLQLLAGPRVELTGFVPDLRPHLAAAAAVVVPLRLGGGTRLRPAFAG
jgi:polysaccharide biosynthesis protein PslH